MQFFALLLTRRNAGRAAAALPVISRAMHYRAFRFLGSFAHMLYRAFFHSISNAALPTPIWLAWREYSLLSRSSLPCPAIIFSPHETHALFPLVRKSHSPLHKKPPAKRDTHIGHEENYI